MTRKREKDDFDKIYSTVSKEDKKRLDKILMEKQKYFLKSKTDEIKRKIDDAERGHTEMIILAASIIDSISYSTGYRFYRVEPLIEFADEKKGNQSLDILFFNEKEERAIFVECKSSIGGKQSVKDIFRQIENAKNLVEEKLDYLNEILGRTLDMGKIEFVLLLESEHRGGVLNYIKANMKDRPFLQTIKIWEYYYDKENEFNATIMLYHEHSHHSTELTHKLRNSAWLGPNGVKTDIPFLISEYDYMLFKKLLVGECYQHNFSLSKRMEHTTVNSEKNSRTKRGFDPKVISKECLLEVMKKKHTMGINIRLLDDMIERKVESVIDMGLRFYLLKKIDDERVRLLCRGESPNTVKKEIRKKYIENWIKMNAEKSARKAAVEEYRKKHKEDLEKAWF